jgi:hypothetical protein
MGIGHLLGWFQCPIKQRLTESIRAVKKVATFSFFVFFQVLRWSAG